MRGERFELVSTKWIGKDREYTGEELRGHFVREISGIRGDGVVAFPGGCDVKGADLVDLEDAEAGNTIKAARMIHFIGEHFLCPLREGNYRLRLFISIIGELIEERSRGTVVRRKGDDLYIGDRKLTVAIVTVTPASSLFHCGVNIDPSGAPVPAVGIEELGLDPEDFALEALSRYRSEIESVEYAVRKVRSVC